MRRPKGIPEFQIANSDLLLGDIVLLALILLLFYPPNWIKWVQPIMSTSTWGSEDTFGPLRGRVSDHKQIDVRAAKQSEVRGS